MKKNIQTIFDNSASLKKQMDNLKKNLDDFIKAMNKTAENYSSYLLHDKPPTDGLKNDFLKVLGDLANPRKEISITLVDLPTAKKQFEAKPTDHFICRYHKHYFITIYYQQRMNRIIKFGWSQFNAHHDTEFNIGNKHTLMKIGKSIAIVRANHYDTLGCAMYEQVDPRDHSEFVTSFIHIPKQTRLILSKFIKNHLKGSVLPKYLYLYLQKPI